MINHLGVILAIACFFGCKPQESESGRTRTATSAKEAPKGEKGTPVNDPGPKQDPAPKQDPGSKPASSPGIEGVWTSSCAYDAKSQYAAKMTYKIEGGKFEQLQQTYSDEKCTKKFVDQKSVYTYKLGSANAKVAGAFDWDLAVVSTETKFYDQNTVSQANANISKAPGACAKVVYAVNTYVNDTACAGLKSVFTVVSVQKDSLFYGSCDRTNDCSTAAKRAVALAKEGLTQQK